MQSTTPNETPTVAAPPSDREFALPLPPRVPFEFGPFERDGYDPNSDPLRDIFPLRPYDRN